jgi:putative DNA primase/helicase
VFDAIVGALRELPSVHLAELPRMADYALWGAAVGRGLGWGPETFVATYTDNRQEANLTDLLNSPRGTVLLATVSPDARMCGTPANFHAKLEVIAGKNVAGSAEWPKTTEKFGQELRRLAPQLRQLGISVTFERRNEGRLITVQSEHAPIVPSLHASSKPETS